MLLFFTVQLSVGFAWSLVRLHGFFLGFSSRLLVIRIIFVVSSVSLKACQMHLRLCCPFNLYLELVFDGKNLVRYFRDEGIVFRMKSWEEKGKFVGFEG